MVDRQWSTEVDETLTLMEGFEISDVIKTVSTQITQSYGYFRYFQLMFVLEDDRTLQSITSIHDPTNWLTDKMALKDLGS